MKQIVIITSLLFYSLALWSQDPVNPICDETFEIPYTFNYSGFILFETGATVLSSFVYISVEITEGSPDGLKVFDENYTVPFSRNGYFNIEIGSNEKDEFYDFIIHLNENSSSDYFINVFYRNNSFQYVPIGSKPMQTVPYAMVANSINGIGQPGEDGDGSNVAGADGQVGQPGYQGQNGTNGANGSTGEDGFGVMVMRSSPPPTSFGYTPTMYVDDGTNTADGQPRLRYKLAGNWIDL